jgi:ketosteroid isomerase-like protein
MQAEFIHRRRKAGALGLLLGVCIAGAAASAPLALDGVTLDGFRPEFHRIQRVSCRPDSPLPRALIDAAGCGDLSRVRARLAEGGDVNETDSRLALRGRTALHHAVQRGDTPVVALLVAAGANPNVVDAHGDTPLHLLAMRDRTGSEVPIARLLIGAGADVRARNARGRSAMAELVAYETQSIQPLRLGALDLGALLTKAEAAGPIMSVSLRELPADPEPAAVAPNRPLAEIDPEVTVLRNPAPEVEDAAVAVRNALQSWAAAWSARDVEAYLAHYASEFRPADGKPVEAWRAQRRERVAKAEAIEVKLADIEVTVEGNRAIARFEQDYRSKTYKAVDRKVIALVLDTGKWRILEETSAR